MKKTVLVIINNEKGETLFLLRAKKPFGWALPGGKVNDGETSKEGLIREVFEETGIDISSYEIIFVKSDVSITGNPVEIFSVKLDHTPVVVINKKEHLNKKWIWLSLTYNLVLAGNTQNFILQQ